MYDSFYDLKVTLFEGYWLGFLDKRNKLIRPSFYEELDQVESQPSSIKDNLRELKKQMKNLTNFDTEFK